MDYREILRLRSLRCSQRQMERDKHDPIVGGVLPTVAMASSAEEMII